MDDNNDDDLFYSSITSNTMQESLTDQHEHVQDAHEHPHQETKSEMDLNLYVHLFALH